MQADQNQAALVLLGRVAPLHRPPKEPLADNQVLSPPPPVNHSNFPSVGSAAHEMRRCDPCAFFWKEKGCRDGQGCLFCHVCQPGEKKRRKEERRIVASRGNVVSVVAKFQNILPISLKALTEAVWRAEGHELTDDTTILLALLGPMPGECPKPYHWQ